MKTLTALLVIFRTGAGLMLIVYLGSLDSPEHFRLAHDRRRHRLPPPQRGRTAVPRVHATEIVAPGGYKVWINSIAIDCDWRAETSIHLRNEAEITISAAWGYHNAVLLSRTR